MATSLSTTHGSGDNYILIVGDFSNYVIADRIGMSVELVPHLFATGNNRPSGQRGFFAFYRTGADSLLDGSLALLTLRSTQKIAAGRPSREVSPPPRSPGRLI